MYKFYNMYMNDACLVGLSKKKKEKKVLYHFIPFEIVAMEGKTPQWHNSDSTVSLEIHIYTFAFKAKNIHQCTCQAIVSVD